MFYFIFYLFYFILFITTKKKERRQRGLQHMIDTKDQLLLNLQPSTEWDDWIKDLKEVIDNSHYHSDEVSESDEEKG